MLPGEGSGGSFSRRTPHVLTTESEVAAAVKDLLRFPFFVVDIETRETEQARLTNRPNPLTNDVLWIGLGAYGRVYLIPMGHPKGVVLEPAGRIKVPANLLFAVDDPLRYTEGTRKLPPESRVESKRMIDQPKDAVYADSPDQLYTNQVFPLLEPLLFSDRGKIGHNVKFDLLSCAKYFRYLDPFDRDVIPPGPYHDTIVVKHTLVEDEMTYELKPLICDWFGVPKEKRQKFYPNMGKAGIENFGLDEIARYLAKDVYYCWLYFQRHHWLVGRKQLDAVYDFEMTVYPVIMKMEQVGFPVDLSQLDAVRLSLNEQIATIEAECYELAGDEFSLSDPDAKRWVLFGKAKMVNGKAIPEFGKSKRKLKTLNLPVFSVTPKEKRPSVTAAVLDFWTGRGVRMAELLSEWAKLEKLRGTFVEGITGFLNHHHNGGLPTIHTGYKQHGTVTGRLSSVQPNLQQLPREQKGRTSIRKLFVSGPGHVLIVADYDQIELRCLAYEAQDPTMIDIFKRGLDIHRAAAAAAMQIALAMVTDDFRQVGKTLNFATGYGAGPQRIAAVAGVSEDEGQRFLDRYYEQFARLEPWKNHELQLARKRGDRQNPLHDPPRVIIPPYGRLRRLPDLFVMDSMTDDQGKSLAWKRYRAERQAINAIIQGFAAYITKLAMIELDKEVPWPMLAQVHDEIIFRVPEDEAFKVMPLVKEVMEGILDPRTGEPILGEIPLVASVADGTSWADAKAKAS